MRIVPFTLRDVPFGKSLTDAEGWHSSAADWKRLTKLEPEGSFKAVLDGKDVGTTGCLVFERVAWVHSVIVREDFRGLGIGNALMRACLDFLRGRGVSCVKLDSNPGVEPFYESFGFKREYLSMRYVRLGGVFQTTARRLEQADYEDICAFDHRQTGLDRRRVLEAVLEDFPHSGFVVRGQGRLLGYVMIREGTQWNTVGPCVVGDADSAVARDLLQAALDSSPADRFRVCVGGFNHASCALMERLGFSKESYCTRMFLGEPFAESDTTFAMISAQKG